MEENLFNVTEDLESIIINEFPLPIAKNYLRVLEFVGWEKKTRQVIHVFEFTVRSLALILISQYLLIDREKVSNSRLNKLLREKLPKPSLGSWVEILFTTLASYKDHRDLMFMPELYDAYWDTKQQKPQKGVRELFNKIVVIRNHLAHELPPQNDMSWQTLFEESHNLILQIFEVIRFIGKYDLIFITRQDKSEYQSRIYRGQEIRNSDMPLHMSNDASIGEGWFYLARGEDKNRRLLKLYPFLIAWEKDIDLTVEGIQSDAAFLDKFSSSRIYYLATVLWEIFFRQDENLLKDFFYNYEMPLGLKIKEEQLSWKVLKETTREIFEQNMGDPIKKYNPKLYLERNEVRRVFEDFLESDKCCLVITGKSGVGKTNFLMATIEAFQNDPRVCIIAYNGARLPADSTVSELFRIDLATRFNLSPQTTRGKEDVWGILSGINDISDKKIVVLIDAINENPQSSDVLRRLDLLIGSNPYPWLKFVITSRPEAWRVMSRRMKLAEHRYYWRTGDEEMGVELREFGQTNPDSLAISIDKFSHNEAELAYQKYQAVFSLVTDYSELALEIKQALQDPLMLRLMAEIYKNKSIPSTLRVNQVYADFIDALKSSGRLTREDIIFLQNDLIPKLASKLDNAISEDDILADKVLYEVIFNTDILSTGRQVNQSYINLVDAEILVAPSQKGPISIAFKYERFYDYFMGEHIYKKHHNSSDIQARYQELAVTIRTHPFLWGAVKNALISELETGQEELLYKLACQSDQALRELVIAVLTEYGQGRSDQAVILRLLKRLLAVHRERLGRWGKLRQYLPGKIMEQADPIGRGAAMTALETARRLRLIEVLEEAVQDPSQYVRVVTIRNIYQYWRMDKNSGFTLLEQIANKAMNRFGIPNLSVLEVCLGVSVLLMGHYDPLTEIGSEVGTRLLAMWQKIIRRLLFVSKNEVAGQKLLRSAFRNLIVETIINFIVSTQESLPETRKSFLSDVSLFFNNPQVVKDRYRRLVMFFESPKMINAIRSDLIDAVYANDALTSMLIWLIMIPQGRTEPKQTLELLEEIVQTDLSKKKVGLYAAPAVTAVGFIAVQQSEINDDLFIFCQKLIMQYLDRTQGGIFYSNQGVLHSNSALGEYVILLNRRRNPPDLNLCAYYLKIALHLHDNVAMKRHLVELPVLANVFQGQKYVLDAIEQLFPLPKDGELVDQISTALAKIRSYHPDLVDEFLLSIDKENELFYKVVRQESREQPWADLMNITSGAALIKLIQIPLIRKEMSKLLLLALEHRGLKRYLKEAVTHTINLIVGLGIKDE